MESDKTINTYNTKTIYALEFIYPYIKDYKKGRISAEECINTINRNIVEFLLEEVSEYKATLEETFDEINNIKR
tara:strand:+ start:262 stop:483 length:222 start_codon:yes stop_codon:yes gene_type:complete